MISSLLYRGISSFSKSSLIYSPSQRITIIAIQENFLKNISSKKFINNIKIGLNCTSIALKYSKCYLCKVPGINQTIRKLNNMQFIDKNVDQANLKLFADFPQQMKFIRYLGKYFKYQDKNLFSAFSLLFTQNFTQLQAEKAKKFIPAIESITLGYELHYNIDTNYRPNKMVDIGLKIIQKVIKDKYLVLAGDYFHIKASVLGGQTKNIELSRILAEMQINLCKYVYLKEQLKAKIDLNGYKSVSVDDIHLINRTRAKQIAQSLTGMDIIKGNFNKQSQQRYNCIGLMILYRKQLQNFMFNFYKIFGKYLEYTKQLKLNFCEQYSLTNYLFFQSAQHNQRIDIAYLNTVQMMNKQIGHLQQKLKNMMSQKEYKRMTKKINYIMMIHS